MLAFERFGSGHPLVLLHGTTSSRQVWEPLHERLAGSADVIAVDLPGHGDSPPLSYTPPEWAQEVAGLMEEIGVARASIVGHSSGGWTALELARSGRADSVLALAPAGLWRHRSPRLTDLRLYGSWRAGRALGPASARMLRSGAIGSLSLRAISARPRSVPADLAVASALTTIATESFPRHFRETRVLRFRGGGEIAVPVKVIWGGRDRIAIPGRSTFTDELPPQTQVEVWPDCGHMLMWDAPGRILEAIEEALGAGGQPASAEVRARIRSQ